MVGNYELRSRVFQLDETERLYQYYKLSRRIEYCKIYDLDLPSNYHPEIDDDNILFLQAFYPAEWQECEKIYKADKARKYRLSKKIRFFISSYDCYFIRLGFWDSIFSSTSEKTRRRYVVRFLDSLNVPFIANIDFGEDRGREHYHAIIGCRVPLERMRYWYNNFGGFNSKRIRKCERTCLRLSKYVSKLCNHAVKVTCKRGSLIYSRKYPLSEQSRSPISAEGYVLSIAHTPHKHNYLVIRPSSRSSSSLVARCAQCGCIIPVLPSDMPKYTVTVCRNGKNKKLYFCSDCIKEYNIKCEV